MPVDGPLYPINLILTGHPCLVVGGGAVAARKVAGLLAAEGRVRVVATVVGPEVRALGVPFDERPYRTGDLDGEWLVIAATDDPAVNRGVWEDGNAKGVWVNSADEPGSCSFILPAVARQGPVMVAISTAGHSPALATWLKGHVTEQLVPEIAVLAEMLSTRRAEIKAAGRSTETVDWRPALDWEMLDLIRAGDLARVRERLQACLSSSSD